MGVKDPGGYIPLANYYSSLGEFSEPRRKMGKKSGTPFSTTQNTEEEKFLVMEATEEGKDLSRCNPFLLQKIIENAMGGKPEKVTRLKGGRLLIRVKNEKMAGKAYKITKISDGKGELCVKVAEHPTLNSSKGIIRCPDIEYMTEEEIKEGLAGQKVTEVAIMKRKVDGQLLNTKTAILTFNSSNASLKSN
ncbi:uncharacterized protein LOC125772420 [Anopheles funestus]|uniref:uncharacterized protein LOC125772420 n=1 Tax=Anopheles funestus TaxID=62324 RepID=UPI0020C6F579|nr:uncharacterized protein LOC125772420 [Anopheles funestus]